MDILYRRGRATAAEVQAELPGSPNSSTVRTQLRVLAENGKVRYEEVGLRYVYAPAPACSDAVRRRFATRCWPPASQDRSPSRRCGGRRLRGFPWRRPRRLPLRRSRPSRSSRRRCRSNQEPTRTGRRSRSSRGWRAAPRAASGYWAPSSGSGGRGGPRARGGGWARLLPDTAAAMGVRRPVDLRTASTVPAPATWGWRRPVILVPEAASAWPESRVRLVLLHELAHVRRQDWPIQLLAELACAVHWFNPLTWIARDGLRRESDRACDDLVLRCGVSAAHYGTELADIARLVRAAAPAGALLMARPSSLERRIVAMLDPALDRRPLTRRTAFASGALVLLLLVPAAMLGVAAQEAGPFTVQVFDPSGGVLPGTALDLAAAGQGTRSATTEGSGRAVFDGVAPGDYTISATLAGFRTLKAPITIGVDRDRLRSITLQVGELTETVTVRERRPPAGAAPQTRGVVEPLRIGGNIKAPKKLRHVAPEYPTAMRDAGLEGTVPTEALIGRDGLVASVRVLSADVHPEFARAAEDAVRQWLFSPTLLNGEAVDVRMAVHVRFSLQDQ